MPTIQAAVAALAFEEDDLEPYSAEAIARLQAMVGGRLPDDLAWYMSHVGAGRLRYDAPRKSVLIEKGDYLYCVAFERLEHPVFVERRYEEFRDGVEGALLPAGPGTYLPLGELRGGYNPEVSLRLLIGLSENDRGAIWAVHTIGHFGDQTPRPPYRLADDLTGFLARLRDDGEAGAIAKRNNDAFFMRLVEDYVRTSPIRPTTASRPEDLLRQLFEDRGSVILDGVRNVEFQWRSYGQWFDDREAFAERADWFAREYRDSDWHGLPDLARRSVEIGVPRVYDGGFDFSDTRGFHALTVRSTLGESVRLEVMFLFYRYAETAWTLVRRHEATIQAVRVKDLGTFAFDQTHGWRLKRKLKAAWSPVPVEIRLSGREDGLTAGRLDLVRAILGRADFRPTFERHVFDLYTRIMYPEFEAMDAEERAEWADAYPRLASPDEIWRTLGKSIAIDIEGDDWSLQTKASWDPEHGLSLRVKDWRID